MLIQESIVGLVVVACALQAAWALMPGGLKQRVLSRLGRAPATPAGGCGGGCSGCGQAAKPAAAPAQVRPVVFHRRAPH